MSTNITAPTLQTCTNITGFSQLQFNSIFGRRRRAGRRRHPAQIAAWGANHVPMARLRKSYIQRPIEAPRMANEPARLAIGGVNIERLHPHQANRKCGRNAVERRSALLRSQGSSLGSFAKLILGTASTNLIRTVERSVPAKVTRYCDVAIRRRLLGI
jgi:hypothetical protein